MARNAVLSSENKEGTDHLFIKRLLGIGKFRVVFHLKMNLDSGCIFFNKDDGSQPAMLVQEKFQMDLKVHLNSISVEGMIGNLEICDMSLGPDHWWSWLWWAKLYLDSRRGLYVEKIEDDWCTEIICREISCGFDLCENWSFVLLDQC